MAVDNSRQFFRTWWIAMRPFSFPASLMPLFFGTALAIAEGGASFHFSYFILAGAGVLMLHGGANILNDVHDLRRGFDQRVLPVSGALVRGLASPRQGMVAAVLLFTFGSALGVYLALEQSWHIIWVGAVGVSLGVVYSATVVGLKYRALGDLAVFLSFGLLVSLGGWLVQGSILSWIPLIYAAPIALLIVAILHANNWRDIEGDTAGGCKTIASLLGVKRSHLYYGALLLLPYLLLALFVFLPVVFERKAAVPFSCFLVLLTLPMALKLIARVFHRAKPESINALLALDGATARLSLLFGALYTTGLVIHIYLSDRF